MKVIDQKSNPYVEIEPEEAQEIFDKRQSNRPINQGMVSRYARAMSEGKWKPCTTISFCEGKLEDGQHRMLACIMSGEPFKGFAHFHADHDMFETYDQGHKRSNADVLAIAGHSNTKTMAQVLQVLEKVNSKQGLTDATGGAQRKTIQPYEIQEVYDKYNGEVSVSYSCYLVDKYKHYFKVPKVPVGVLHYYLALNTKSGKCVDEFIVNKLLKGLNLSEGDPVFAFRNFINRSYARQTALGIQQIPHRHIIFGGIAVWNKWVKGKSMKRLTIPEGNHPPKVL
jgi:hypothetical protein